MFNLAHVKWFIDYEMNRDSTSPIYDFSISNPAILTWISIVSVLVALAFFIHKQKPQAPKNLISWAEKHKGKFLYFFQACVGISLLFASYSGTILLPHYIGPEGSQFLHILEGITGLLLILNIAVPIAAVALLITYFTTFYYFSFVEAIDYINLAGISIFLFLEKTKRFKDYKRYALPALRIFTGLALFILAFSEKLLFQQRAQEFLGNYELNFMKAIGFESYSDTFFALSAGAMEAAFGIILILGLITRLNVLVLTGFFLASNIFFFVQGHNQEGLVEFMGHLPIVATAIFLIAFGSGKLRKTT